MDKGYWTVSTKDESETTEYLTFSSDEVGLVTADDRNNNNIHGLWQCTHFNTFYYRSNINRGSNRFCYGWIRDNKVFNIPKWWSELRHSRTWDWLFCSIMDVIYVWCIMYKSNYQFSTLYIFEYRYCYIDTISFPQNTISLACSHKIAILCSQEMISFPNNGYHIPASFCLIPSRHHLKRQFCMKH